MAYLNRIEIIGNIGNDAEVKTVGDVSVVTFSVACTDKYKDAQGQMQQQTTWFSCDLWRRQTGIAQYLKKGTQVWIAGRMRCDKYTDRQGVERTSWSIRVESIELLGGRREQAPLPESEGLKALQEKFNTRPC